MLCPDSTRPESTAPDNARPPASTEAGGIRVELVRLTSPTPDEFASGLLAYITIEINGVLRLDGLTVRRTRAGRIEVQYPERMDRREHRRPYVSPTSAAARREIERQLHAAIRVQLLPTGPGECLPAARPAGAGEAPDALTRSQR